MKRILTSIFLVFLMASQSWAGAASYSGAGKDTSIRSIVLTNDGVELTTNGTFTGSAAGWTLASGWTYSTNAVNKDGAGTGALEQDIGAKADAVYALTFTISAWTAGTTLTPSIGGVNGTAITGNGTYTQYITSTGVANLKFTPTTDVRCTIDTITVKRVDAIISKDSSGNITGVIMGDKGVQGYTLPVIAMSSSPADAATVYFGFTPAVPSTSAAASKVYIRKAGVIKNAEVYCFSGTAGTNENWSLYVRLNNTTDYLIATVGAATSERVFSNTGLSIPVVAGDYFEIKGVQPTWVTNPLLTVYGGYVYIE